MAWGSELETQDAKSIVLDTSVIMNIYHNRKQVAGEESLVAPQ